jgi:translation initiation factor IF-3
MSSWPLFLHALSVPRRVLRSRQCIYTKYVPIIKSNDHTNRSLTTLSLNGKSLTKSSHSLSVFAGMSSFSASGRSSCNPSLHPKIYNSPTLLRQFDRTSRTFASRRGGQKGSQFKKKSNVVANEELVAQLIRNAGESSADEVTVRLVTDEGPDTPSSIEVMTLSEAIVLSLDRELDLIGANITGDPPVIRATQLSKLEYKQQQAQKKQQQSASNKKEKKAFRFKAGIEANDLERKLGRLKEFLSKGHDCDFSVFVRLRTLRQNPNAGFELVEQIKELLSEHGDMKRPPQINETKQFHRVQFEPKK